MRVTRWMKLVCLVAMMISLSGWAAAQVTDEMVAKVKAAAPAKAQAQPQKPRNVLVFKLLKGFPHDSTDIGAEAVKIMGEKTGAFASVISVDPAVFEPQSLSQFDAVVMMNTTGDLFDGLPKERVELLRKSFLDFVRGGKGVVGVHAATDCFYNWPEYGEMMGGYFQGHPWGHIVAKNEDPSNPVNAAFGGQDFEYADEIYTFKDPYSRQNLRVLLSVDLEKSKIPADPNRPGFRQGENRNDHDYAVSWIRNYGSGRVFYTLYGHPRETFWQPKVLQHILDGIQFAIGDLKADATPSAKRGTALFNGKDLSGWKGKGWVVEDGAMSWRQGAGDIWAERQYGDFVLDLELKVAKGTNSGIFIRTANPADNVQTGIEIQVLDSYGQGLGKHICGAVYDCLAPSKNTMKPAGEWNRMSITAKGNKIQVALNGEQIIDMDLNQWTTAGMNPDGSKNKFRSAYKDMPKEGFIGFQDHGGAVWYRNVTIRPAE